MIRRVFAALLLASLPVSAQADDLYHPGGWSALASDRNARQVGDVLTVLVYENSSASDSASSGSAKDSRVEGTVHGGSLSKSGGLDFTGGSQSNGSTGRSGQMVAQISVRVGGLEPNGDLDVSGEQVLHINREHTLIRIKGRVRPADISSSNTVLSSRIADAAIDYDGSGFVSRSARPGPLTRLFNWLGLM
jgi:flagellar L-ring protein FlgH